MSAQAKICALPSCGVEFTPRKNQPGQKYHAPECGYQAKKKQNAKRDKKPAPVKATYKARGAVDADPNKFNVNASADQAPRMLKIPVREN